MGQSIRAGGTVFAGADGGAGLTRNHLARLVNTRYEVIDKWYKNEVEKIDADILARLCFVLDCKVEELLVYRQN